MALVRVYCGLASAELARSVDQRQAPVGTWLTVAIVDDSGRLLEVCDISDDPMGYAHLSTVLAERSTGPTGVSIAADSDDHLITTLLMAAGRPLAFADDDSVDDYAERFADDESPEEMESPPAERRAVGLARALQAGALSAVALPAPREMAVLKPVLAAHAALAVGRQAAAVALREVLRELYPAALRAYPDPAESVPLAVLDALPEPGLVGGASSARSRDAAAAADALASQLAAAGIADVPTISEAITALRVAIAETPRRGAVNKSLTNAAAETVRQAVAAVRACDAAQGALIAALAERANPPAQPARPRVVRQRQASAPAVPAATLRAVREATAEHPAARLGGPRRNRPSAAPVSPAASLPARTPAASVSAPPLPKRVPAASVSAPPSDRPVPPPPPGITPIVPLRGPAVPGPTYPVSPAQPAPAAYLPPTPGHHLPPGVEPFRTTVTTGTSTGGGYANDYVPIPTQRPASPTSPAAAPGSRPNWPLSPAANDPIGGLAPDPILGDPYAGLGQLPPEPDTGRITPPWQADDLPEPSPLLRLVEPPPLADPALRHPADSGRFDPPALRLVDNMAYDSRPVSAPHSAMPGDDGDSDLLIFAAARSAWFSDENDTIDWTNPNDAGWRAAAQAAEPAYSSATGAGLPKRVPQANLVPGSPFAAPDRPLRIVRDPASIAAHTSGYFSGWRRGQEIGGYAVGGRPGRESAQGWEFARDHDDRGYDYDESYDSYDYRPAAYHSR